GLPGSPVPAGPPGSPPPPGPPGAPPPPGVPAGGWGAPPPPPGAPPGGPPPGAPPYPGAPPPPGYGAPWGAGPPPAPAAPDPHGIGAAVARLSGNGRRAGRVPLVLLAALLGDGDTVAVLVVGRFRGEGGAAALVGDRVVLVNERQWKPDVV